jgi:hypothetical protein
LPDWLIERGIGESRAVRLIDGEIAEARILLDAVRPAGTVLPARLRAVGRPAIAEADGESYLVPTGSGRLAEGAAVEIEITRERIPGGEAWKRPLARLLAPGETARPDALHDAQSLAIPAPLDRLEAAGWSDLLDEARERIVRFAGGELRIALTPAMTLIDVDGTSDPEALAVSGAAAAAAAIRRHGVGGSIGIDLPTVRGKETRQRAADAIDAGLGGLAFERTAVNGFGFVQIVRPRRHASLFELAADRAAFEARVLLRRAARSVGAITLVAHPAVIAAIDPLWIEQLAGQIGGTVALRGAPGLAMAAGHVENA